MGQFRRLCLSIINLSSEFESRCEKSCSFFHVRDVFEALSDRRSSKPITYSRDKNFELFPFMNQARRLYLPPIINLSSKSECRCEKFFFHESPCTNTDARTLLRLSLASRAQWFYLTARSSLDLRVPAFRLSLLRNLACHAAISTGKLLLADSDPWQRSHRDRSLDSCRRILIASLLDTELGSKERNHSAG